MIFCTIIVEVTSASRGSCEHKFPNYTLKLENLSLISLFYDAWICCSKNIFTRLQKAG
jgi:hypothetical protein